MLSRYEIANRLFPNEYPKHTFIPGRRKHLPETVTTEKEAAIAGDESLLNPRPWPILANEAHHGLAGDIVRTIEPHSEADPVAILINLLLGFGNTVGAGAYVQVGSTRHYPREFATLVGETSKGRKGLSWDSSKSLLSQADPTWGTSCIKTGLSSGEGLIFEVRDPIKKQEPIREGNPRKIIGYEEVITDQGVSDKRRLIIEPEFSSTLTVMNREGNILSAIIRQAWDDGILSPLTKSSPITSTGAHISILGHITQDELLRKLSETEKANGFANRFLWALVRRSKCLPEGGALSDSETNRLSDLLGEALNQAKQINEMKRDDEARELWAAIYPKLSEGKPGLTGALLSRSEAHVLRISMFYALLDSSSFIKLPHLKAALAVWDYVEASVKYIFGESLGDPIADRIIKALKVGDLSETEIRDLFARHNSKGVDGALAMIHRLGLAVSQSEITGGRPRIVWRLATKATDATKGGG